MHTYYVETYRPPAPVQGSYARAHKAAKGQEMELPRDVLSPSLTALFRVEALNVQSAIAMVCEYGAGLNQRKVTVVIGQESAVTNSRANH